jgi:hypothetical protein
VTRFINSYLARSRIGSRFDGEVASLEMTSQRPFVVSNYISIAVTEAMLLAADLA